MSDLFFINLPLPETKDYSVQFCYFWGLFALQQITVKLELHEIAEVYPII